MLAAPQFCHILGFFLMGVPLAEALSSLTLAPPRRGSLLDDLPTWAYLPITHAFGCTLTRLGRALGCIIVAATSKPIATARLMAKKEIHMCSSPIVQVRN